MVRLNHQLNGHEFEQTPRDGEGQGNLGLQSQTWLSDRTTRSIQCLRNFISIPTEQPTLYRTQRLAHAPDPRVFFRCLFVFGEGIFASYSLSISTCQPLLCHVSFRGSQIRLDAGLPGYLGGESLGDGPEKQ